MFASLIKIYLENGYRISAVFWVKNSASLRYKISIDNYTWSRVANEM